MNTEHDVFRDRVGLRVVTYTGNFDGAPAAPANITVDFAREDNVDGKGLVLIIRCAGQRSSREAEAKRVAESLRLKNVIPLAHGRERRGSLPVYSKAAKIPRKSSS